MKQSVDSRRVKGSATVDTAGMLERWGWGVRRRRVSGFDFIGHFLMGDHVGYNEAAAYNESNVRPHEEFKPERAK